MGVKYRYRKDVKPLNVPQTITKNMSGASDSMTVQPPTGQVWELLYAAVVMTSAGHAASGTELKFQIIKNGVAYVLEALGNVAQYNKITLSGVNALELTNDTYLKCILVGVGAAPTADAVVAVKVI